MIVGDAPRDITVEHNTVDSNGNTVLYVYGGSWREPRTIYGFRFSSNAARHRTYGINGQFFGSGNTAIAGFFPDGVFETNYLAGGSLTRLPAGTLVQEDFEHQFVDTVTGDYTVRDGMILVRAASDGSDIGVRFPALIKAVDGVEEGRPAGSVPVGAPTAALQVSCTYLVCDFADTSSPGSGAIRSRAWSFGDGSAIQNGPSSGTHRFARGGTYAISLIVEDVHGLSAMATTMVQASRQMHSTYSGATTQWASPRGSEHYWSAQVIVLVHDADERPIEGATVTAAWNGAVAKTVTMVTDVNGRGVVKSGTLSYDRSTVTLNVTAVTAPNSLYVAAANHDAAGSPTTLLTMVRP